MNLKNLLINATLLLVLIITPIWWIIGTQPGLHSLLTVGSWFSTVRYSFRQVNGTLLSKKDIAVENVTIEYQGHKIQAEHLEVNWRSQTLYAQKIQGLSTFIPQAQLLADQNIIIDELNIKRSATSKQQTFALDLHGQSNQAAIRANMSIQNIGNIWFVQNGNLDFGNNYIRITENNANEHAWQINLSDPQVIFKNSSGALTAHGVFKDLIKQPSITGIIASKDLIIDQHQVRNLHGEITATYAADAPLKIKLSADKLFINNNNFEKLNLNLSGSLDAHDIIITASHDQIPVSIKTKGYFVNDVWHSDDVRITYNQDQLQGPIIYDLNKKTGFVDLEGTVFAISTKLVLEGKSNEQFHLKFDMRANLANYLHADLGLKHEKIDGTVKIIAEDMALVMKLIPDVTRLKAKLVANAKIGGTLSAPKIITDAHVTDITATFPSYGVKVKPMELHLKGDESGKFIITGKGEMRRGPGDFTINGFIEPFKPGMPNSITLLGNHVEFIKNDMAHLIASSQLNFHYEEVQQRLDVTGNIEIHEGSITIADKSSQTVKSKDVVFVDEPQQAVKESLLINPDINLRIEEGVHFNGFGLNADVTGKLDITRRHDAMFAEGRVTIKEGTFQLPGQKLSIHKGRLLYPPGTLLVNPVLDIKMQGKKEGTMANEAAPDLELVVQGTAQKPVISESGLTGNKERAISQALLTGTSMLSNNLLQDKLKISEIGVTGEYEQSIDFFDDPSKNKGMKNKNFVIGRPIGRKFYVQYLQSMDETGNKRVRLKYALNKTWAIGLESGTLGGGADLMFTIERD